MTARGAVLGLALACLALAAGSCGSTERAHPDRRALADQTPPDEPYVLVLGTAQDGGLPQIGCRAEPCESARREPARRRLVSSLLLCDPRDGRRWLFDCTPDLAAQVERARAHPPTRRAEGPRAPLFDGIFLTHAHVGHYAGLLALGRETYGASRVPTWVTPRFARFLGANGPWSQLVAEERILLHELDLEETSTDPLRFGAPVQLAPDLSVRAFRVPHRDEFSDTVGFEIRGPRRTLVYLPDIDKWERWDSFEHGAPARVEALLARCDVALLDGCFFADGEIPGRAMHDIPHPFVSESLARFAALPASERAKVHFTHLNHTNPCAQPGSAAEREVRASGAHVLAEGARFGL